jgi:hypothetical protein
MTISHATIDKARVDEREANAMSKELESLKNSLEYYKDTTQVVLILKEEFSKEHNKYKLVRDAFVNKIGYSKKKPCCAV